MEHECLNIYIKALIKLIVHQKNSSQAVVEVLKFNI